MRHVQRDGEDVGAVVEDLLGAVAVMDVPVDDGDPLHTPVPGPLGGQRGVPEHAVTVGLFGLRVVPRRPHQRVRHVAGAVEHGVHGGEGRSGGGEQRLPRAGGDRGRGGQPVPGTAALLAQGAHLLDVRPRVDGGQFGLGREASRVPDDMAGDRSALQDRLHVAYPGGALGVRLLFGEQIGGRGLPEAGPGVVVQDTLVPEHMDVLAHFSSCRSRYSCEGVIEYVKNAGSSPVFSRW